MPGNYAPTFPHHHVRTGTDSTVAAHLRRRPSTSGVCWPNYDFGGGCNYTVVLDGWFGDLADLRQEHTATASYLLDWIRATVAKYELDGLRLDTATYIPRWFLQQFQAAANVYIVGEVVTTNGTLHRSYSPPLSGA